jgi:superfamily II DNA or RNA helicase
MMFRERIRASLIKHRRSIACAPPGCGKTRVAKHILASNANREVTSNQSGHSLFAVHRRGLVDNAAESFGEVPVLPHRVVMSGRKTENTGRVHVASIDTLNSWFANGGIYTGFTYDLIVYDECHAHLPSLRSMLAPHDAKREADGLARAFVLGLSATPQHRELNEVFSEIVYGPETQWLIDNGFLSSFRYFQCTQGDLNKLVRHGDEYTESSVADAMSRLAGDLVSDWKRHAEGRATVGFFPRKTHAQEAVERLLSAGIVARYVDCDTSDDERREMFADLNEGRIQYIANVGIVERGTDIPRIGCVQMCTAVGNVVRWKQMIGRGSRIHPLVQDCIVLDHAHNVRRLGFFEDEVQWSLDWGDRPAKTHETRATMECPSCKAIYRGGQCRKCGYEPTRRERKSQGLDFIGGELVEVDKKEKKPKGTPKTNEQLLVAALFACSRSNRTFRQAIHIARRAAEKQNTEFHLPATFVISGQTFEPVPFHHEDGSRHVAKVYGVTVGDRSRESNPYRKDD